MDYSKYKILEFRRKYFKLLGAEISIKTPDSNALIGYIKMKAWNLRGDVRVYSDNSMTQEIVRIGGRQIISFQKIYDILDSTTGSVLVSIRQKSLKSWFVRDHMDIFDPKGDLYGYVQETSSSLAVVRRWIAFIPYIGGLISLRASDIRRDVCTDRIHATISRTDCTQEKSIYCQNATRYYKCTNALRSSCEYSYRVTS